MKMLSPFWGLRWTRENSPFHQIKIEVLNWVDGMTGWEWMKGIFNFGGWAVYA